MAYDTFPIGPAGGEAKRGRLFYCDTTLFRNLGHFANSCRHLTGEARRRGIKTLIFGNINLDLSLGAELGAEPLFRQTTWYTTVADPLSGTLESFFLVATALVQDLETVRQAYQPGPDDTIYWNSARSGELLGLILWLQDHFSPDTCPRVVMEFGTSTGARLVRDEAGRERFEVKSLEACFYRYAIRRARPEFRDKLTFATFDPASSADYQAVLGMPVTVLPLPQAIDVPLRQRPPGHRPRIAFLGHQRPDKGYRLISSLVRHILARHPALEVLVHNGAAGEMPRETAELAALAETEARFYLVLVQADGERWQQLLDLADLIVLPYQPDRFTAAYSAILSEACSQGIPVVAPQGTTLSAMLSEFGGGELFQEWTVQSIAAAIDRAVADFDELGQKARAGAAQWRRAHGPGAAFDAILGRDHVAVGAP